MSSEIQVGDCRVEPKRAHRVGFRVREDHQDGKICAEISLVSGTGPDDRRSLVTLAGEHTGEARRFMVLLKALAAYANAGGSLNVAEQLIRSIRNTVGFDRLGIEGFTFVDLDQDEGELLTLWADEANQKGLVVSQDTFSDQMALARMASYAETLVAARHASLDTPNL